MIHPSYVELMDVVNEGVISGEQPVVNSRFSIVSATAKRARQIIDGAPTLSECDDEEVKPLSMAVLELYEKKLKILTPDEVIEKEQELSAIEDEIARLELERKAKQLIDQSAKAEEKEEVEDSADVSEE